MGAWNLVRTSPSPVGLSNYLDMGIGTDRGNYQGASEVFGKESGPLKGSELVVSTSHGQVRKELVRDRQTPGSYLFAMWGRPP